MTTVTIILYYLLSLICATSFGGQTIDVSSFESVISDITNKVLGVDEIQKYYNSLSYSRLPVEGNSLAVEISSSLSSKFSGPIQALEKLKSAVEQDISTFSRRNNFGECCQATGTVYNERFKHWVNMDAACITISENSPEEIRYPTTRIMDVMKGNYRDNPELKWQFLGTEDGILLNYPSFKFSTCRDYDPRFRPFYVSSATPVEKDLVVVIDTSGSMGILHGTRTLIQIAKQAAISVIQTLSPNDRFAVVKFSSEAVVLGLKRSCVGSYMLSEATPLNIKFFEAEINRLTIKGSTNYEAALDTAFRFFESSNSSINGEKREKVILFLTDGKKTSGNDPYDLISRRNGALGNQVVILTYGLGASLPEDAIQMLQMMAKQGMSNASKGEIQEGIFEHIRDPSKLRSAMASYYNLFSKDNQQRNPSFTVPYIDLFGLGLMTSLCLPVYNSENKLFGAVCSDITIYNLLSDITYFRQGENSYSFIIDGRGRTLMHPLLPLPLQASDDPVYVYIQHLERANAAQEIIEAMKSGMSGNKTFYSSRTVSRGDVIFEGITTKSVRSSYNWMPVSNSNFSLCIVAGTEDVHATINALQPNSDAFYYHRRDMLAGGDTNCVHFNRFATTEKSAVMINPGGFLDPSLYLETEETDRKLQEYTDFLTGETSTNPGFKPSILNSVTASYRAEEVWKGQAEAGSAVIWRYFGTTDGVMRVYPAVQLPKNYDQTRRPWFARSIANKGNIAISTPYLDLWGAGYLITLSTAVTEPSSSKSTIAVVATDTTIPYLYEKLLSVSAYSQCRDGSYHCFIVDNNGFVILHKDFIETSSTILDLENVHITFKEPAIAEDLVANNYMIKTHCIDFENIKEQFTYRITTPQGGLNRLSSHAQYEIHPVTGTNVFIVKQRNVYITSQSICCKNYGSVPDAVACSTSDCGCLCYRPADFNYCTNEYLLLADAGPTCSPRTPALETKSINEGEKILDLPRCYSTNCSAETNKSACHGISGCSWCSKDKSLNKLASPYCTWQENCYFGIEGLAPCVSDKCGISDEEEEKDEKSNKALVIGGSIGGVAAVAGVVFCCILRVCRRNKKTNTQNEGNANSQGNQSFPNNIPEEYFASHRRQGDINTYHNRAFQFQPTASTQNIAPPSYAESYNHPIYPW